MPLAPPKEQAQSQVQVQAQIHAKKAKKAIESVQVAVRIRPLLSKEKLEHGEKCVSMPDPNEPCVQFANQRSYTYDYVFGTDSSQEDIFSSCVAPLIDASFDGYNATVFAYGQTGSGKTYTMGSGMSGDEREGVIPRSICNIFERISDLKASSPTAEATVRVEFLEIYGETIRDLLDPVGLGDKQVVVRESESGEVCVSGCQSEVAKTADELLKVLERGTLCRTTGSTRMNSHSSRSHAIFTVLLEVSLQDGEDVRSSRFNFVDLAGSERAKKTGAVGLRLREGININVGLLALGNVISALGDPKKKGSHVPYRDSKLTRMLQDSLGAILARS